MSLTWDVSTVKDYETLCWIKDDPDHPDRERVNPVTEALVFHCVGISMNGITKANADEFYARVAFVEKHQGSSVKEWGEDGKIGDRPITREDVQAHVGLRTNVSNEPLGRWVGRNFKHFYDLKGK